MKVAVIVNPGLETLAQQEIEEFLNVKCTVEGSLLSFEIDDFCRNSFLYNSIHFLHYCQSSGFPVCHIVKKGTHVRSKEKPR